MSEVAFIVLARAIHVMSGVKSGATARRRPKRRVSDSRDWILRAVRFVPNGARAVPTVSVCLRL